MNEDIVSYQYCARRISRYFVKAVIGVAVFLPIIAASQGTSSVPAKDSQAVSLIQKSLMAMTNPGIPIEDELASVNASGTLERPGRNGEQISASFDYLDLVSSNKHEFRRHVASAGNPETVISNHGHPQRTENTKVTALSVAIGRSIQADYSPYACLWMALKSGNIDLRYIGQETFQGQTLLHISTLSRDASGLSPLRRDWYIDSATFLPALSRAHLHMERNPLLSPVETIAYSSYKPCGSHLCPMEQDHSVGRVKTFSLRLTATSFSGQAPVDKDFTAEQ